LGSAVGSGGIDELLELGEEISGVMGARGRFGMVLNGDHGVATMSEALQGIVVKIDMGDLHVLVTE
jgi:hypothetical protein